MLLFLYIWVMAEKNKSKIGAPPIHTNPLHLASLIKDYYEWIEGEEGEREIEFLNEENQKETIKERYWIRKPEPPTITGLTLHLGFSHKSSLYDYAEKPDFSDLIKGAITRIEKYHEIKVSYGDKCVGNIFVLKNFGWTDRVEHEVNSKQEIVWHEEKTYETNDKTNKGY